MSGLAGRDVALPSRTRQQENRQRTFTETSEALAAFGTDTQTMNEFLRDSGYRDLEDWFETQVAEFRRLKLPIPERPGFMREDTWDLERLVALADQLGAKLQPEDVTPGLRRFAAEWLRSLPTPITFEYLRDMRFQIETKGGNRPLTIPQAKGVLNCAIAEAKRRAAQAVELKQATPAAELEAGIYFKNGVVYKVVRAVHGSGKMYAKRLVTQPGERAIFEYAQGVVRQLTADDRMTLEQATEFGALYGVCCNCGATLTDETSIELGIGPVCRKKFVA